MVARLALVVALAALAVHAWLFWTVVRQLPPAAWSDLLRDVGPAAHAAAGPSSPPASPAPGWPTRGSSRWASSRPAVREPRRKVIRTASVLLVGSVLVTVPVFTAVAVEAVSAGKISPNSALLAEVALRYGGPQMRLAVVLTGALLLLLAAKLAFIGCYNVFQAIGEHGYLPAAVGRAQSPGPAAAGRGHRHHRLRHPAGAGHAAASRTCWPSSSPSACSARTSSPRSASTCCAGASAGWASPSCWACWSA